MPALRPARRPCAGAGLKPRAMAATHRSEGVIAWQGRMLVYRHEPDGRWRLRFLGEEDEVQPGPALLQALEADIRHQDAKRRQLD